MGSLQQTAARAAKWWQLSCDLCGRQIAGSGLYFAEVAEGLDPPSAWTLCARCGAQVTQQLERIRADAPMRLRIAVGVAASELGVTRADMTRKEAQAAERRQEDGFNRLLIAVVWIAFLVHAAAFVLVVAVIAATR